jgi:alpha-mannosidase
VRVVEMEGKPQPDVHIAFAGPLVGVREVNGQEMPLDFSASPVKISNGEMAVSLGPYELRTFAVRLAPASAKLAAPRSQPVALTYDLSVASADGTKSIRGFDAEGRAVPAEMLPASIDYGGIEFKLAPASGRNAVAARGQSIALPAGSFNRAYLLAASSAGDQKAAFRAGDKPTELTIQDWSGFLGQWDTRTWNKRQVTLPPRPGAPVDAPPRTRTTLEYTGLKPAFIKPAPVAWFASHRHTASGENEPYAYSYLFAYSIDLPAGARTLVLPENANIRILAVTVAQESDRTDPAQPLYDTLERPADK